MLIVTTSAQKLNTDEIEYRTNKHGTRWYLTVPGRNEPIYANEMPKQNNLDVIEGYLKGYNFSVVICGSNNNPIKEVSKPKLVQFDGNFKMVLTVQMGTPKNILNRNVVANVKTYDLHYNLPQHILWGEANWKLEVVTDYRDGVTLPVGMKRVE